MADDKILSKVANEQLEAKIKEQQDSEGYTDNVAEGNTTMADTTTKESQVSRDIPKDSILLDPTSSDDALYAGMNTDDDIIRSSESMPIVTDENVTSVPEGVDQESWGQWAGSKLKDTLRYAANPLNVGRDVLNKPGVRKFIGDVKEGYKGNTRSFLKEGGPVKAVGRYGGNVPGMKHGGMKK